MKSQSKLLSLLILVTLAFAGATSVSSSAEPDGTFVWNDSQNAQGSNVGKSAAAISQNGQFVSGQDNVLDMDQTTYPGSRADLVQIQQAAEGRGRDK